MANLAEESLVDEAKKLGSISMSSSDKKMEFISLPFEMNFCGASVDRTDVDLSSRRNQIETSLASYGFVFDNSAAESMATGQFSVQNPVNMAMSTYYDNINVMFANNSAAYPNAIFLPYLSYGGGLENNQLNYIPIAFPNCDDVRDAPEFIDLSEMPMGLCERDDDGSSTGKSVAQNKTDLIVNNDERVSSDDDIIFVGSYVNGANNNQEVNREAEEKAISAQTNEGGNGRKGRKRVNVVAERKNPKRMTRSCKATESLALKLSIPQKVFNAKIKLNTQQTKMSKTTSKPADVRNAAERQSQGGQEKKAALKAVKKYKPKISYSRRKVCCNYKGRSSTKSNTNLLSSSKLIDLLHEASELSTQFLDAIKACHDLTEDHQSKEADLKAAADIVSNCSTLEAFFKNFA